MQASPFTDAVAARAFILAGNATVTFVSRASGARFTFRAKAAKFDREGNPQQDNGFRFISLLNGADNENNFAYFGYIRPSQAGEVFFHGGAKARVSRDAASVVAFQWAWARLARGEMPTSLEVWHEGRCGRCGRKLTVPASVASGFGPECAGKVGAQ